MMLESWKINDLKFVATRAAKHVFKCVQENKCVTITASSGVGKTTILRHVALQMKGIGFDLLLITSPQDILKFYNPINLETEASQIVQYYDLYDCFPLLCNLYNGNSELDITDFFPEPILGL